jgi:hypothetical protein
MELSENLKLRLDNQPVETQQERLARAPDPGMSGDSGPADAAESQMRKALGLLGETSRNRQELERMDQPNRMGGAFGGGGGGGGGNGGLHRRRFVQDGDIPVTVLRREPGLEQPAYRSVAAPTAPTSSRLQRTEAALAAETSAREKAERSLAETQFAMRDLQTKIGHAELAKNEAVEALRRERESIVELRAADEARDERIEEALEQARHAEQQAQAYQSQLADERHARKATEKALRTAEAARDTAEQLVQTMSEEARKQAPAPVRAEPVKRAQVMAEPEVVAVAPRRGRPPSIVVAPETEPEPVKWWLNTKPVGKKR